MSAAELRESFPKLASPGVEVEEEVIVGDEQPTGVSIAIFVIPLEGRPRLASDFS